MSNLIQHTRAVPPIGKLDFMYLNITDKCNLRCFYCYDEAYQFSRHNKITLDLTDYANIVSDCVDLSLSTVAITGGEPFINRHWYDIGMMFSNSNIAVTFSSNGTLLDESKIKLLSEIGASLQISLDGDDDTMEFVSGGRHVFSKIVNVLNMLAKYNVGVSLNCVVGTHNYNKIDEFMTILESLKQDCRFVPYHADFNSHNSRYVLSIQEKHELIMKVNERNRVAGNHKFFMSLPVLMTPEFIPLAAQPGCGWAYNLVGVLSNGDVTVCAPASGIKELVAGNIKSKSLKSIWNNSELFSNLRNYGAADLQGVCSICPVSQVCMGDCRVAAYLYSGDIRGAGTLCQEVYNAVKNKELDVTHFPAGCVKIETDVKQ